MISGKSRWRERQNPYGSTVIDLSGASSGCWRSHMNNKLNAGHMKQSKRTNLGPHV
jgi:Fe-S cluster biogenesis protein NfuA